MLWANFAVASVRYVRWLEEQCGIVLEATGT